MASKTLLDNILETVRTKSEAELLRTEITHLEERIYHSDISDFEEGVKAHIPERIAGLIRKEKEEEALLDDRASLKMSLEEIQHALDLLPVLRLDIAFDPSEKVVEAISDWVRKEVGGDVLLDIGYDRTLGGGARVMYKGKYKEWTLAEAVDEALSRQRARILKEFVG